MLRVDLMSFAQDGKGTSACLGLQEVGLNEVFSGGLSSYSVVNMVMAHLSLEGMDLNQHMAPGAGSLPEISHTIDSPEAAQDIVAWRLQQIFSASTNLVKASVVC